MGSRIPISLTEATISERSPNCLRGWCGFGSILSMSIRRPTLSERCEVISSTKWLSWRMRFSGGSPRNLDTTHYLLGQAVVLVRTRRIGSEGEDALLVGGTFLEADTLRDHGPEDLL